MKISIPNAIFASMLYQAMASDDSKLDSSTKPTKRDLQIQTRIVGGTEAERFEYGYYVDLLGCGGSLIAPGVVLTAAHCGDYTGSRVIVGGYEAYQVSQGSTEATVITYKEHPNYDDWTTANDFALLRLSEEVGISGSVTLGLNSQYAVPADGQTVTTLGLGALVEGGYSPSILNEVDVFAISGAKCNSEPYNYDGAVQDDIMFCAGVPEGGKDSCQGDSGGPIVLKNGNSHTLIGVVSWGYGCARPESPGVYARVSSAYTWIQQVVCDEWGMDATFCGPTEAPRPTEAPQPTASPTELTCSDDEMLFDFTFNTDDYGYELSWNLKTSDGTEIFSAGEGGSFGNNASYRTKECITKGCHTLTILDTYGDG